MKSENMTKVKLGQLQKSGKGRISEVGKSDTTGEMTQRLMEMGFLEGSIVEVMHLSPFGGDPIVVRVRGAFVALRRSEADFVEVLVHD